MPMLTDAHQSLHFVSVFYTAETLKTRDKSGLGTKLSVSVVVSRVWSQSQSRGQKCGFDLDLQVKISRVWFSGSWRRSRRSGLIQHHWCCTVVEVEPSVAWYSGLSCRDAAVDADVDAQSRLAVPVEVVRLRRVRHVVGGLEVPRVV